MDSHEQNIGLCWDKALILIAVVMLSPSMLTVCVNRDRCSRLRTVALLSRKSKNSSAQEAI